MKEKFWMYLAWLLPRGLVYHATVRLWVETTVDAVANEGEFDFAKLNIPIADALGRWEEK